MRMVKREPCPECGTLNELDEIECVKCGFDMMSYHEEQKEKGIAQVVQEVKKIKEIKPTAEVPPDVPKRRGRPPKEEKEQPEEKPVPRTAYGHMTQVWTPALGRYGGGKIDHPWMHWKGNKEVNDENLLEWALCLQDNWRAEYNEHLLPEAVHYVAYWIGDEILKNNCERIRALLRHQEKEELVGVA